MERQQIVKGKWGNARRPKALRIPLDNYPTPECAVQLLLKHTQFNGHIWEPACGDGAIAHALMNRGYTVMQTDLRTDSSITGKGGVDFLLTTENIANIVTNPPFCYAQQFITHALECAEEKVVMLMKLAFLESERRYHLFKNTPLHKVLVISNRLPYKIGDKWSTAGGQFAHCWYIFDKKNYTGQTTIDWALWE